MAASQSAHNGTALLSEGLNIQHIHKIHKITCGTRETIKRIPPGRQHELNYTLHILLILHTFVLIDLL